jgi:glycosyltransferase involved in cell wall biosynthesis
MMHLAINATEIGRQRGGNETHLRGLLKGLVKVGAPERVSLIVTAEGATDPLVANGPWKIANIGSYRRIPFLLWQQTLILRQLKPDWYFSTYFLPPVLPCAGAVLVHDMSFRAHPDYYPRSIALYMRALTGVAIKQARCVLVGSEFSRRELLRFHPDVHNKTTITWNGVESEFVAESSPEVDRTVLVEHGVSLPYLLAIGNIHPRKNMARLLEAYQALRQQGCSIPMVWVGLPRWGSEELLERARQAGVILTGFVPQVHLPALYRQATVFIYPSLYEGFGLPVVESMACGTPVVCSNTTSLPEVAGQAALLVNPESSHEIAAAIKQLLDDPALAKKLRQAGLERVKQFTWASVARRTLEALCRSTSQ